MAKIICTADWHVHAHKDFSRNVLVEWDDEINRFRESKHGDLMNSRLLDTLNAVCDMRDYALKQHIAYALHAGDLFHTRATVDVTSINSLHKVLSTFKKYGLELIVIAGNHDQVSSAITPESALRSLSDVLTPVEYPTLLDKYTGGWRIPIAAVPYSKDMTFVTESVNTLLKECDHLTRPLTDKPILLAHAGIDGGVAGSGMFSMKDSYALSDFQPDRFQFCIFGHYHQPQRLGDNAIYCGSLTQNDFGDERKGYDNSANNGFWVIDTAKNGMAAFEFVPSNSPRFITVSNKSELKNYAPSVIEKAHIRVRATESASEEIKEAIQETGNTDAPKMEVSVEVKRVARSEISIHASPSDAVRIYAKENGADASTLAVGMDILKAVMSG